MKIIELLKNIGEMFDVIGIVQKIFITATKGLEQLFRIGLGLLNIPVTGYIGIICVLVITWIMTKSWKIILGIFIVLIILGIYLT